MHVVILGPTEDDGLEVRIVNPLPNVPEWILIYPAAAGRRFLTLPDGHTFEDSRGDYGYPLELRTTARRFLDGKLDETTAAETMRKTLAAWSRATG